MIKLNRPKKKVSVVMPFFRKKDFFEEAYNSVLNQSYSNIEIIIIYDDYDREQLNFVRNIIKKHKTIIIVNNKNRGASYSRNIGIKKSKGYYVAFLDCDDIWHKNKLEEQITFMERFELDCTCTNYSVIDKNGHILYSLSSPSISTHQSLLKSCDIGLSTVVIKKKIFKDFKFLDLLTKEDYLLWLNMSKKGINIYAIKKKLAYWRDVQGSLSSNFVQRIKDSFKIYYYYEKQFLFQSIISIIILSINSFKKKIKRFYL